jgi:hypothetical protein
MLMQVVCATNRLSFELCWQHVSVDLYMLDIFSADEDDWQKVAEVWCNQGSCAVSVAPAKTNGVQSHSWDHPWPEIL